MYKLHKTEKWWKEKPTRPQFSNDYKIGGSCPRCGGTLIFHASFVQCKRYGNLPGHWRFATAEEIEENLGPKKLHKPMPS